MSPTTVERSLSMSDVEALTRHCRTTIGGNFPKPYDLSAAVGYGDKKDFFKIVRPKIRKFRRHKSVGLFSGQPLRRTKSSERFTSKEVNGSPGDGDGNGGSTLRRDPRSESKDERITTLISKKLKSPICRGRSKAFPFSKQSTSEGKAYFPRKSKCSTLLPHLKSCLGLANPVYKPMESDVVVKFPERSVLLLAQDEDEDVKLELSSSSVVTPQRRGDSGVQINDGAVLTWRPSDANGSVSSIPSASSTLLPNQAYVRRVSTKSSLHANYLPSLERLVEEPSPSHKDSKQQINNVVSESAGSSQRKDLGEVVVSYWTRTEQQGSDPRLTTKQSGSFENRARTSSLSLVNEVTEEVLFRRSSTNISEAQFEKQGKEKTKQRRVTIATEHIANELSPHYATKLEKEAFRKIKEWKEEFAIRLDQVLKQRQVHNQDNDNTVKSQRHNCAQEDVPCKEYAVQSVSKPLKTQQDPKQQILIELRGFSESSVRGVGNSSDCETGSRILQEIKKQRRNSKRLGEKHLMENLSSWHRQETGRITNELCSYTSDVQHIRGLLYSLKETIDTIFTTTMQRVDDFISSSTMENDSTRLEHAQAACNEAVLLKNQIKRVEEERDRLLMENWSLNKQITELRSKLEQVHKGHESELSEMEEKLTLNNDLTSEREISNPLWYRKTAAEISMAKTFQRQRRESELVREISNPIWYRMIAAEIRMAKTIQRQSRESEHDLIEEMQGQMKGSTFQMQCCDNLMDEQKIYQ